MNLRDLIAKHENNNNGGNKEFPKVNWFSLKNDGDEMVVRFLHKDENDLEAYEVHEVEIDGYKTKVQCAGQGCPLCAALGNPKLRDVVKEEVQILHIHICQRTIVLLQLKKELKL